MPDINNPEIKKNDIQGKGITTSTGGVSMASISTPIPTPQSEVKYPVEDLIKNSKALTGYGKEVAVGALFNCKEKELAKDEFKKIIKDFLWKKVE